MDPISEFNTLVDALWTTWAAIVDQVRLFALPGWRQYQLGIIVLLIACAWGLRKIIAPRFEAWSRTREGWPKWRLRLLVQIRKRIGLLIFCLLSWAVYLVMQELTWPSRSYMIGLGATIASVWLAVGFLTRLVRNPTLRRILAWTLWICGTLFALGLFDEVSAFLDGLVIGIGEFKVSVLTILQAAVIVIILLIAARFATQQAATTIRKNEDISPSMRVLAVKGVQLVVYGIVFMLAIRALGFDLTGLAVLSGAIGLGIGFGLQKVVSNLISGIIILLDKSIKPGDVISLGETFGWIDSLGARYVSVVTRDGKEYLIPNEDLITGQVVNWSHTNDFVRIDIFFGTAYGDDPHLVRKVAVAAAAGVTRVLSHPNKPVCHIVGFGDSSVDYILRFWIRDPSDGLTNIRGNVYLALWDAFKENGISIPFPQREVKMLEGSTLGLGRDRGGKSG